MNKTKILLITNILFILISTYLFYTLIQLKNNKQEISNSNELSSQYQPKSRERCLDNIRAGLNDEFTGIIKSTCSSKYSDIICETRLRSLIQNQLIDKILNCINTTEP